MARTAKPASIRAIAPNSCPDIITTRTLDFVKAANVEWWHGVRSFRASQYCCSLSLSAPRTIRTASAHP